MFEHSLYEPEPVVTPSEEGDLFHNYEIKSWELSKRIYQILGVSAFINVLALLVFSQTSVLTMKGCESPLVGNVCQVLDTIYVGSKLFGTDREYVDAVYDKTEIGDADVTFVDVSGEVPPLSYPEGYFQLANPEQFLAQVEGTNNPTDTGFIAPGIPITTPSTPNNLINTPQTLPKSNPNPIAGDLPSGFGDVGSNPTTRKNRRGAKPPVPDTDDTAGVEPEKSPSPEVKTQPTPAAEDEAKEDKFGVYINKRPLKDRAKETIEQVDKKQVKLDSNFKVGVTGVLGLGKDGKTVVLKNPKPVAPEKGTKNDPAMEKLVQDWILAVGDAGWFGYLERLDEKKEIKAKKVLITVEQNDTDFYAVIRTEQPDENMAKSLASGLNVILQAAGPATSGDEQLFIKAASSTSEKNYLILNVQIPKTQVQDMIQRKLAESKEPAAKPNSTGAVKASNNNASK